MRFAYADPPYPGMAHFYGCRWGATDVRLSRPAIEREALVNGGGKGGGR